MPFRDETVIGRDDLDARPQTLMGTLLSHIRVAKHRPQGDMS
jgi:hypothetical protein